MDKVFDKNVRKYLNKSQSSVLSITFRNNEIVLNGESQIVEFVSKSNSKEVTLEALFSKIQDIEHNKPDPLIYSKATQMSFPLFPIKFKSNLWNWKVARAQMGNLMKVLGFRRGNASEKTYAFPEHQPQGWPEAVRFKKAKFASKDEANMVIESILRHHGIDPYSHHVTGADGGNAGLSRETVDSDDEDNEEPVHDALNNNGPASENRDDEEPTAAAAASNQNNNNNSDSHVNNPLDDLDSSAEEEDIIKFLEEDDKEELSHESAEESEEDETSKENVPEGDDDNVNEELSPYESEKRISGNERRKSNRC